MAHVKTGGLVAAPTTGLPEMPGGSLNWDYRYCWLRDFDLHAWRAGECWLQTRSRGVAGLAAAAIAGSPDKMRIMYRVDGSRHLNEWTVDSLPGHRDAAPVRIGNAASTQHQIDVYGEVFDCFSFARRAGLEVTPQQAEVEVRIVDHLAKVWNTPVPGFGSPVRNPGSTPIPRSWHGSVSIACSATGSPRDCAPADRRDQLEALRQTIHDDVCREGWNPGLGTFTQIYGDQVLDASLLLLPLVGFLPANDPRIAATIAKIESELSEGGLIRRLKAKVDGPNEGAFLACSFWMADCLTMQGRHDEAVAQFERVIALANDVGLLSEEYNVPGQAPGRQLSTGAYASGAGQHRAWPSGPVLKRAGG